jgi:hypothetical protein
VTYARIIEETRRRVDVAHRRAQHPHHRRTHRPRRHGGSETALATAAPRDQRLRCRSPSRTQ